MKPQLVVMARAPRIGRVKRRLAVDVGAVEAWRFYRQTTGSLLRSLSRDPRWRTCLAVTPDTALRRPAGLWPHRGSLLSQGRGDLGQRMGRLIAGLPSGPVVVVGSDVPDIAPADIAAAFDALGPNDWVLGPAGDGGYWLIGARRRPHLRLPFDGVSWSSPRTLQDTLANLAGQEVTLLRTLDDIDHGADLARWRRGQAAAR